MQPGAPLTIHLRASRRLLAIGLGAHAMASAAILLAAIPGWAAALLLVLVGASLARMRKAGQPRCLILHDAGQFDTVNTDGEAKPAQVHPQSVVLGSLVVLRYRQDEGTRSLILPGDSLDPEEARQLRLWLRWRSAAPQAA